MDYLLVCKVLQNIVEFQYWMHLQVAPSKLDIFFFKMILKQFLILSHLGMLEKMCFIDIFTCKSMKRFISYL
jgi:hypothetical protein